jgi:RecQ family ATP-dependent DNA helicase
MDEYEKKRCTTERYKKAKEIIKKNFGHNSFKPYQYQIIDNILDCRDVLAVMPTGYGKSLCFQFPPLISGEVAIVISPLIALMADQKMILDNLGITCCCYNSDLNSQQKKAVEQEILDGNCQILYITPESLTISHAMINRIYTERGICMIAIDEAHCLSSYGFDFRPKYKEIVKIRSLLSNVPVLAVTATATEKVMNDIVSMMNMNNCEKIKTSFDRPNLMINVSIQTQNTTEQIIDIVRKSQGPSIIYCLTKKETENMAEKLKKAGIESRAYHAGLKKEERTKTQKDFMEGVYSCITATVAFGMGINKSDIRSVIHYGCPQNIESYYQEIGRAGRDGKKSTCYMFYKQRDFMIQQMFIGEIKDRHYKVVRQSLLHQISQYVNVSDCRRKHILKYFGQNVTQKNCNMCDNCTKDKEKKLNALSGNDGFKMFQLLATISEIQKTKGYTFGTATIGLIMKGSKGQKVKPWMRTLMYFGSMKTMSTKEISSFILKAIDLGYIENHDVGNCVRVVRCTQQGNDFGESYEDKLVGMMENCDENVEHIVLGK